MVLRITDNGVGLRADARTQEARHHGRGLDNMQARASAIGAVLRAEPGADGGVCVVMEWRATRAAPMADGVDSGPARLGEPTGRATLF